MAGDMVLGIQNKQTLAESRCYDSGRKVVVSRKGGGLEDLQCMPRILRYVQWDNLALEFTEPLGPLTASQRGYSSLQAQTKVILEIKLAHRFYRCAIGSSVTF